MVDAGRDALLVTALTERARLLADLPKGEVQVLSRRSRGAVVRLAGVVVKAHAPDTDPGQLEARLRLAAAPDLDGVLLRALPQPDGGLVARLAGYPVTAWPAGEPVDPDQPDLAPWSHAGVLLARLHHATPTGPGDAAPTGDATLTGLCDRALVAGGPARVIRALARLEDAGRHPASAVVRDAAATLPPWAYGEAPAPTGRPRTLCHGDWHLGQLVRVPDGWRLVDVDDLGYGDPAWDLARPAAWYATGLMPPAAWRRFLDSYRRHGGPAVPADRDPWPSLDVVARALVVQMAALSVVDGVRQQRALDEVERSLVETCRMIIADSCGVDVP
ncbi:MAG: phosphotransferase [Micromonosporaceae bacterium]